MALTPALRTQIIAWYKMLQAQIPDFIPRAAQRQMIAEVAKTLTGEAGRHLVLEAPTGVGKTLSYLIPGIAIAREQQKTLVVSTANVALQDQIDKKDLPLLAKIIPELRFTAAFGRGRYICPRNLAAMASSDPQQQEMLAFLDDDLTAKSHAEQQLCATLKRDLDSHRWDGLRDHHDQVIDDGLWQRLSTDKSSCLNRNCYYYRECPFFIARREIQEAEVVVTNHALVMAAMESGSVLPEAKDILLIVDEGHHLPDVARDALEMSAEITTSWYRLQLDLFSKLVASCLAQFPAASTPPLAQPERLTAHCEELYDLILSLNTRLSVYLPADQVAEYRFPLGVLPQEIIMFCQRLAKLSDKLRGLAERLLDDLGEKNGRQDAVRLHRMLLQMNRALAMLENQSKLWRLASLTQSSGAPVSKWVTCERREGQVHTQFHCVGIRVSGQLEKLLWQNVPHIVVTSATLRSLNHFSRLQEISGLSEQAGDRFVVLDSPFNHALQGKIIIPQMHYEPRIDNEEQHIAEMASYFRQQVISQQHRGMLVLFASGRAMQRFLDYVSDLRLLLLVQGDQPRYRLVELHRKRIENDESSVLVGLQSFAEGLDLKGDLLTQVHIHKIAFPPIDSPVVMTESEWLKSLHRQPFAVQSLPDASFTLIQQVGRLIRSHLCRGEVVIYDRRLLTKSYGKQLLAALPVFPIEQPALPEVMVKSKTQQRRRSRR